MSALSKSYLLEAERANAASGRFAAAAIAERRLATRLSPLTAQGYYLLADRQWPGSKVAQLDLIVIGPSGVWIVDSKHWNDFTVAAGAIFRDQADVTDEVLRLADVAYDAEEAFASVGLAPGEVRPILVMADHKGRIGEVGPVEVVGEVDVHKHLASRGKRLTTSQVEQMLAVAMKYFPAYVGAQAEEPDLTIAEPVLDELPDSLVDEDALLTEDEVREALTEADLAAPVEDWMTFLHPSQAALVRRTFNGPARIRGGAGTGKTVVGLHRAAYLARMHPQGRILFTTFVRTLPAVMGNLLKRMTPDAADRVEFVSVHSFASRVLRERSVGIKVDSRRAGQLLSQAWATLDSAHRARLEGRTATSSSARGNEYWKEEVESVIKGRGFTTFEQYADCARPGRMVRLTIDDRRAVWALFQEYERLLRSEGINDFQDQVLLAERSLRTKPLRGYAAVIVDEAQDLSLAMIRMLHSLVGDAPDAFTLIGDGQQSIYPGGYVLSEAGISLAGRGVVMDHNYRNTAEIQAFAATLIADDSYTDIDDQPVSQVGPLSPVEPVETPLPEEAKGRLEGDLANVDLRHGPVPEQLHFATRAAHDQALIARIKRAATSGDLDLGDLAILCDRNDQAETAQKLLTAAGIPSTNLHDYQGIPSNAVKVGTVKRAKGLEFKLVMLPWSTDARSVSDDERTARNLRERYVAATRARDMLWVGTV